MFGRLSLRYFWTHKLRALLTVVGIGLGVTSITGTAILRESVGRSYERTVESLAGRAVLQITNGEADVPEELLAEVRTIPGVGAVEASIQGFIPLAERRGERLYVFGVDLLADSKLRDYEMNDAEGEVEDPLVFLAQPDSVALTDTFLESQGLHLGDRLRVRSPNGPVWLTIRGVLSLRTNLARLLGGRVAVMDIFAAQRLFALDRRFTYLDIGLADGANLAVVEAAIAERIAGRARVERPRARGESLEQMLAGQRFGMTVTGLIALLVGAFLTFNTMVIAVTQRRREIGVLRSVGMRRSDVFRLIAMESLALGVLGSVLGVLLGYVAADALSTAFAANLTRRYLPVEAPQASFLSRPVLVGLVLGPLTALVAALAPARDALRIQPLEILRPPSFEGEGVATGWRGVATGCILLSGILVAWVLRARLGLPREVIGAITFIGGLLSASLLAPAAVRLLTKRTEDWLARVFGPFGTLASRSLTQKMPRTAVICSAFTVSLGGAVAIATVFAGVQGTVSAWFDSTFRNIDLLVTSSGEPFSPESVPYPATIADEIAALPGVAGVDTMRMINIPYGALPVRLVAMDPTLYIRGIRSVVFVDGDESTAAESLRSGAAAFVNASFARTFGVWRGATVTIPTPAGQLELPIAAVVLDASDMGVIFVNRALYRERWRDDLVTFTSIVLAQGTRAEDVMGAIRGQWGEQYDLFVYPVKEFYRQQQALQVQLFAMLSSLTVLALAIAIFGLTNALIASVQDEIRSIAMLRAVGATRRQVIRLLIIEAGLVGSTAGAFGILLGSVLGASEIHVFGELFHVSLLYAYPTTEVCFALVAAVVLAAAAGYLPGRHAARIGITTALSSE